VSDDPQVKAPPLTLEQLAQLLPGTGEIMASVGNAWWKCAYAARGGNWELAAYFARRVRGLQRKLAQLRPKYADDLAAFEADHLSPLLTALSSHDGPTFERMYRGRPSQSTAHRSLFTRRTDVREDVRGRDR